MGINEWLIVNCDVEFSEGPCNNVILHLILHPICTAWKSGIRIAKYIYWWFISNVVPLRYVKQLIQFNTVLIWILNFWFWRYMAIMHPLRQRMGKMMTICIAVCIWLVSFLLSLPMVLFATTSAFLYNDGNTRVICFLQWPDGETNASYQEYM